MTHDTGVSGPVPGAEQDRVTRLVRRAGVVEQPPPARVWHAIVAALAPADRDDGARPVRPSRDRRRPGGGRGTGPDRRVRGIPLLAAAAAGALVTWLGLDVVGGADPGQVVASASLAPLAAGGPGGTAEVVTREGHQVLRVELAREPDAGEGYLEVWLLAPDVSGMVTLGVLDSATGEFAVPDGMDLADFPVVDISREHLDGDPGHGGDSVVRGQVGRGS